MARPLLDEIREEIEAAVGTTDINLRHFTGGPQGLEESATDLDLTNYLIAYCNGIHRAMEIIASAVDELRSSPPDAND
jgi:hypothetical protein